MWTRAARWVVAALVGSAMTAVGCAHEPAEAMDPGPRVPIVADDSLVHALDTSVEMRVLDRLELDVLLRERDIFIEVIDGVVVIGGEVWTPLEKERVGNLVRSVAGTVDVANELDIRAPR
jgi:hypothetical protein